MTRREIAVRAMFQHRYPKGFGLETRSWDDLVKETQAVVAHRGGHVAHTGPKRAQALLDMFLNEAAVIVALDGYVTSYAPAPLPLSVVDADRPE